jgi:hypothetical protein
MADKVSKNARTQKDKTQKFIHDGCGGEIKMVRVFGHGKLNMRARCTACNLENRSPKDFQLQA